MRALLLAAASVLTFSGTAYAQDVDWNGFYAGVSAGFGSYTGLVENNVGAAVDDAPYWVETNGTAGLLGAQAGFNVQMQSFVLGLEGSIDLTNFSEEYGYDGGDNYTSASVSKLAALKARAGFAAGNALIYASLGVVGVLASQCATDDDWLGSDPASYDCGDATYDAVRYDGVQVGKILGLGAELMVTDTLSIFGEYSYFETVPVNSLYFEGSGDADFSTRGSVLKAGINAHF